MDLDPATLTARPEENRRELESYEKDNEVHEILHNYKREMCRGAFLHPLLCRYQPAKQKCGRGLAMSLVSCNAFCSRTSTVALPPLFKKDMANP